MLKFTEDEIKDYIRTKLAQELPIPPAISTVPTETGMIFFVSWSSFKLGWMGRPVPIPVTLGTQLKRYAATKGIIARLLAALLYPYFKDVNNIAPVIIMPKAAVEFPAYTFSFILEPPEDTADRDKIYNYDALLEYYKDDVDIALERPLQYLHDIKLSRFSGI